MVSLKDWRRKNGFAVFTIVVMLLGVLSIALVPPVRATATPFSNHMVFIIMENNPLNGITSTTAPYMHSLASTYANSTNFVGPVSSAWSPSLPNYIGLTSGSTQSITDDGGPSTHPVSGRNIIDAFDIAQVTFKFYMENMPSNCRTSDSSPYEVHHNPIPYYTDSNATSACSSLDVPAGQTTCPQGAGSFTDITSCDGTLINDLNSTGSTPSFMWLTPNMCNDMHTCSGVDSPSSFDVGIGNTYLSYLVPAILTTRTFEQDPSATIVITFDEPSTGTYGTTPVYFAVIGPGASRAFSSTTRYTHLNLLATWEANWSLGCITIGGDCGSTPMTEFFKTASWNPHVSCIPQTVRISDLTNNMTQSSSYSNSRYSPGITENVTGSVKRWLTAGATPSGWISPGPSCIIKNRQGQMVASFVEIDGVGTGGMTYETADCSSTYDAVNGAGAQPPGHWCDDTFNIFDPSLVPNYGSSCRGPTNSTCYGRMHLEFDHDWMAAGYCGTSTSYCNNNTLSQQIRPGSSTTLFDFQGFVYWDPDHLNEAWHSFSGWELHPLTAWKPHNATNFVIAANPPSLTFPLGSQGSSIVTVTSQGGFTGTISLSTSVTNSGLTPSCSPLSLTLGSSASSTCTFTASAIGLYAATIVGTKSSVSHATVISVAVNPPPPLPGSPVLRGWSGVTIGESDAKAGNPASAVFSGQSASDMELEFGNITAHGLNAERVIFADPNTTPASTVNNTLGRSFFFSPVRLNRTVTIAEHFGLWLILNTHNFCDWVNASYSCTEPEMGYSIINAEPRWLSFWQYNVTQPYKNVYSQLIYEPLNEPLVVGSVKCATTCPNANNITLTYGSGGGNPIYIQQSYQDFINRVRTTVTDTSHYIVVENAEWDGDFPVVTDTANRTLYNRHWYYTYAYQSPQYQKFDYNGPGNTYEISSVNCTWSVSCAQSFADNITSYELAVEQRFHRVIINTEIGADYGPTAPPDSQATGSCSYSTSSLAFVQRAVNDLSSTNQIGFTLWTNGDWAGLGVYGCINNWGKQLTIPPVTGTPKYTLNFQGYDYDGANEETLTLNSQLLIKLPSVDSPQNAGKYVPFTVDMTSLVRTGSNTLVFTHANWDCGVTDNTKSVQITNAFGTIIFSDPTERPLSCTQSITYTFTV